jgi:hypothetical protein
MGRQWTVTTLLLAILALSASCTFTLFEPSPLSQITGYVASSNSGEPVVGSRVLLHGLTTNFIDTTLTDQQGRFQARVPPDRYEIRVSRQGYAGSQVIGLNAHEPTVVRVLQREVFHPRWSTRPPEVRIMGVADGDRFSGQIPYRVDASADNDIRFIYVALGKTPGASFLTAPRDIFEETRSTGDKTIDPRRFGVRGPTTFEVVVYDVNGNRTHVIREITVIPAEGLVSPPGELGAIAVTLGKQIEFFAVEGQAAPTRANLYVELFWEPSETNDLTGYRIYRSFDGENFTPLVSVSPRQTFFIDADAALAIGRNVSYRVTALRGGDESEPSNSAETRPLDRFDVRLLSPADRATRISRIPTFRWEATRQVGRYYIYGVVLWDTVLGEASFWVTPEPPDFLINRTSYRWNEDARMTGTPWETLQPHRLYEWQVAYAVAIDNLERPTAVSVAINRLGLLNEKVPILPIAIEATENFSFTTGE